MHIRNGSFPGFVLMAAAAGWLITLGITPFADWGFHGRWLVIASALALVPYVVTFLVAAFIPFPRSGNVVVVITTVLIAIGGTVLYAQSATSASCMSGLAVFMVPFFQTIAAGAGLLLALLTKLIAYLHGKVLERNPRAQ